MSDKSAIIEVGFELPVSAARAYQAWTRAEEVRQWWGGWPADQAPEMTFEARPGGDWRFAMRFEQGTQWVSGQVTRLEPGSRLEFTFAWEGADFGPTPVVVSFGDLPGGASRIELSHDQSAGGIACAEGWSWSLEGLRDWLSAELEREREKPASKQT